MSGRPFWEGFIIGVPWGQRVIHLLDNWMLRCKKKINLTTFCKVHVPQLKGAAVKTGVAWLVQDTDLFCVRHNVLCHQPHSRGQTVSTSPGRMSRSQMADYTNSWWLHWKTGHSPATDCPLRPCASYQWGSRSSLFPACLKWLGMMQFNIAVSFYPCGIQEVQGTPPHLNNAITELVKNAFESYFLFQKSVALYVSLAGVNYL